MRNLLAKLALLAIFLSSPFALRAQQDSSSMAGVVTDATGAAIPGVAVTLTNPLKGTSFTVTTDNRGTYRFANVPPTEGYVVTFTHDGFSTSKISDLTLNVGVTRTQDAKLSAGQHETVEVSAGSAEVTLNTTDATIGNNIDVKQLNELPIQSRIGGVSNLFTLQPGIGSGDAVTGARIDQSEITVDGIDVNDIAAGTAFAVVGNAAVDSVEQFTGTIAGLTSATGTGSGGQFQLVTKSGTNNFHGNINEYHQDTSTRSNTWFNNNTHLRRTPLIQNQFGGNFGGPIRIPHVYNGRDKLFFFFNLEDSRIIQSNSAEVVVPLDSFRAGNLNYVNSGANCGASSTLNTAPACISTLSPTQIAALDPTHAGFNANVLSFINARYPHANDLTGGTGDLVNTAGYRFTYGTPDITTNYVTRIDYNMTPTQRVYFRLTMNRRNAIESAPEFPTDPLTHPFIDRSYGYVISHIWTIGQNKVNQFYYGDNISKFDFPDPYNPTGAAQYSFSGIGGPYTAFDGQKRRVPIPEVRDDFNWTKGAHNIAFGGTFKFIKTNSNLINIFNFVGLGLQGNAPSGGLDDNPNDPSVRPADINSSTTAQANYDSLFATGLGVIGTISSNFNYANNGTAIPQGGGGPRAYRFFQTEAYVSDSWKVNKQLTLTYGLRYQVYSVPYEAHGDESVETPYTLNNFFSARQVQSANGIS